MGGLLLAVAVLALTAIGYTGLWIVSLVRSRFSLLELLAFVTWVAVLCAFFKGWFTWFVNRTFD